LNIEHRKGKGDIRFSAIDFLDKTGISTNIGKSGASIRFRLHYKLFEPGIYKNTRVSLLIESIMLESLILLSTELVCDKELILERDGDIDFLVDCLPLSQGTYTLTLFIESNKVVQDWLTNAVSFHVEDGDFYGNGRNYPQNWGGKTVLIKHTWEHYSK
jgi:lipopolysaccharide transport system ATP-binding protein